MNPTGLPAWYLFTLYQASPRGQGPDADSDESWQKFLAELHTYRLPHYMMPPRTGPWTPPPLLSEEERKYLSLGQADQPDYQPNPAASAWFPENGNLLANRLPGAHGFLGIESRNPQMLNVPMEVQAQAPANNLSSGMQNGSIIPGNQRPDYTPKDCLDDIRKICKDTQVRIQALGQAIARQPGVTSSLTDLMSNDLRHIAQQFVSTSFHCRMLEKKLDERDQAFAKERVALHAAHGVEISSCRRKLMLGQERISRLEQDLIDLESGHGNADKRRKLELEKKTEKINNQKRRIKEQQDQIEKMKDKYINGPRAANKLSRSASGAGYDDSSSSSLDFPHSATSTVNWSDSPRIPEPKYKSTLSSKDEEFLINNLKNLEMPPEIPPMEPNTRHVLGGPPPNPYGHFGHPVPMPPMAPMNPMNSMNSMNTMNPMNPMNPMAGPVAPYGFPPMGAYGPQVPPNYGPGPHYGGHAYSVPPPQQIQIQPQSQTRNQGQSRRDHSQSSRVSQSQHALVVRRSDDAELDAEVEMWKGMFEKLFKSAHGWAEIHCKQIVPGAVEEATKENPKLWDYILKVATCHKDYHAAPKHAMFLLNSPDHRTHFISRLLLQYIEQEIFTWKFWLGWDDETDVQLNKLGPITDFMGHPVEQRRDARQQIRNLVEEIVKDEDYSRFRQYKQNLHVGRFKDIAGPFVNPNPGKDVTVGLHAIANNAMEISMKMMTSRLTFSFAWNECGVKFAHDSHVALNTDLHGLSLQHKHTRISIVVTPHITYRDDTGRSILPRGVAKAQVVTMN